jgi:hypothetical protein
MQKVRDDAPARAPDPELVFSWLPVQGGQGDVHWHVGYCVGDQLALPEGDPVVCRTRLDAVQAASDLTDWLEDEPPSTVYGVFIQTCYDTREDCWTEDGER